MSNHDGFALPSVLMLVSVLSILTSSLLFVQYFHHMAVLREVSRLKADTAAQNGIVWAAVNKTICTEDLACGDGTSVRISVFPWGLYRLVVSTGSCSRISSAYSALLGQRQSGLFKNALVYFNLQHQLVFAGESQVIGDVQLGNNGATLGVLQNMKSLPAFPVTGKMGIDGSFNGLEFPELQQQIQIFDSLLHVAGDNAVSMNMTNLSQLGLSGHDLGEISKTAAIQALFDGNQDFSGELVRHGEPLRILVLGSTTFSAGATIYGPVQILSTGPMTIPSGVHIEYSILYSQTSIETLSSSECKAQLISPKITIGNNSKLHYPSALVSWISPDTVFWVKDTTNKAEARTLILSENTVVEGAIIMNKRASALEDPELIVMMPTSKVIGSVYCGEKMTFDGTVIGTVITNDFYFYESPTKYFGWIRSGLIDRERLPDAYLVPIGSIDDDAPLRILDWI